MLHIQNRLRPFAGAVNVRMSVPCFSCGYICTTLSPVRCCCPAQQPRNRPKSCVVALLSHPFSDWSAALLLLAWTSDPGCLQPPTAMPLAGPCDVRHSTSCSYPSSAPRSSSGHRHVLQTHHLSKGRGTRCRALPEPVSGDSGRFHGSSSSSSSSDQQAGWQQELPPGLVTFASRVKSRTFLCTMCGKCCTGSGQTWVSEDEAASISKHLGISLTRFYQSYTKRYNKVDGWRLLKDVGEDKRCIFLQPDNTCAIHNVRPVQCATYPWWPELMDDATWAWEKENICEGFDHPEAPPTNLADAAQELRLSSAHDMKRLLATPERSNKPGVPQPASSSSSSSSSSSGSSRNSSSSGGGSSRTGTADGGCSSVEQAGSWAERLRRLQDSLPDQQ